MKLMGIARKRTGKERDGGRWGYLAFKNSSTVSPLFLINPFNKPRANSL
jgi:hypothetical protein